MNFFCVYVKNRKKFDKFVKTNKIRDKYILDINKILKEDELDFEEDKTYIKILIFNKIKDAIEKNKDIYYIPFFDENFEIEKLLNIRKMLHENNFNILLFYNEFKNDTKLINDVLSNLSKFSNSQIIRDY